ncbi:MAG: ABC transporter ATP-binding protein [Myxococcota bacterium]|nr:ABC transporter ATP-binding protein [Myxococcota bacterium]
MPPLVRAVRVTKKFLHEDREVEILRGIDLEIERGEMLSIVGASGAGKSTLLHILGTLDLPTSGRIVYEGNDVTNLPSSRLADFRNRSIGFVFQFHHLLPEFTAIENVMMPGLIRGTSRSAMHAKAHKLLTEVGLAHRLSHRPGELSGGEQQRVALARALVMEPKLVLADEPTGNLDSKTSEAMHELFFELNRSRGVTFLIVTHSNALAALMPRVVHMRDGNIERDERRTPGALTADADPAEIPPPIDAAPIDAAPIDAAPIDPAPPDPVPAEHVVDPDRAT